MEKSLPPKKSAGVHHKNGVPGKKRGLEKKSFPAGNCYIQYIVTVYSMAKRARSSSVSDLTGGTGDVNPQFLSHGFSQTAADTFTEDEVPLPVSRIGGLGANRARVVEILKVWLMPPRILGFSTAAVSYRSRMSIATRQSTGTANVGDIGDPDVIMSLTEQVRHVDNVASGSFGQISQGNRENMVDLTDGAGHGVLVATNSLFFRADTSNRGTAGDFAFRILYRFKDVSVTEYVGIVQSQS